MDSPVDVGNFAEPRKILCQCALLAVEQLSVHPRSAYGGAGIPQQAVVGKTTPLHSVVNSLLVTITQG
jgi:hypothetical protein